MSKLAQEKQDPRFLLPILKVVLPRGIREQYIEQLKEVCASEGDWIPQSIITAIGGYKNQAILAFDKVALALQLGGVAYCFSAAPLPVALGIILGATLGALVFRGAYTYAFDSQGKRRVASSPWQYSL